jgi:ankyrin repeat protein
MSTDGAGKGDETELSPLNSTQVSAKTLNVPKETEEGKEETKTGKGKAEGGPTSSEESPKNAPRMTSYQRVLSKAKDVSKRFSLSPSKAQQDDVSDQTALFNEKGTIWEAVKSGNIDAARAMCKQKPKLLDERGPVGENPLHLCFLFNMPTQLQLAKDLLTEHPEYLDAIYENDTYHGETYLHIAIVNKDLGMVEWLLEKKPELLYMRADGIFFSPSKKGVTCYYGEYPLAFAVSTNNFPMFEFLMSKDPLQFWQQDSQGNTILHMCITYDLQEMYSYILKMEPELRRKLEEEKKAAKVPKWTLETARNHDGHTPLTYSTQTKEPGKMTVFVINSQKQTQWSYGPVSCNIYPLEEADTIAAKRKAATWGSDDNESHDVFKDKNGKPLKAPTSALDLIIQGAALEVLMSDYFKDLLHKKWTAYAGNAFYMRCFRTTLFILALTLAQLMGFPSFDVYSQDSNASTGVLVGRFITDLLVIVGLLIKGHTELGELYESGWSYFNQTGSAFLENNLSFSLLFSLPLSMLLEVCLLSLVSL